VWERHLEKPSEARLSIMIPHSTWSGFYILSWNCYGHLRPTQALFMYLHRVTMYFLSWWEDASPPPPAPWLMTYSINRMVWDKFQFSAPHVTIYGRQNNRCPKMSKSKPINMLPYVAKGAWHMCLIRNPEIGKLS
jgi:hypothetical protein